jgi:hypothetical protein
MNAMMGVVAMATCLAAGLALAEPDQLAGEWAIDGNCRESRMVFDFEGGFDLRVAEDGRWKPLYGGRWSRSGKRVEMTVGEVREHWQIESISTDSAVLVNIDGPVDRDLGIGYLSLTRCPAF